MNVTQVLAVVVRRWLQVARLPFTAAEAMLHREGDFGPTLAFESFGANVKKSVGSFVRDNQLVEEGRLEGAAAARMARAQRLEREADQRELAADAELAERLRSDQADRERVEQAASERLAAAERDRRRKEQTANRAAKKKEQAAREAEAASQRLVDKRARAARSKQLGGERKAVGATRKAVAAKKTAKRADEKLQTAQKSRTR